MSIDISQGELVMLDTEPYAPPVNSPHVQGLSFLVPKKDRACVGVVTFLSGLEHATEAQYMALAILPGWLCFCDINGLREYVAFEQISRISVVDVSGATMPILDPEGRPVYKKLRNQKGLSIQVVQEDQFTDELLIATQRPAQAFEWQRKISQARRQYVRNEWDIGIIQRS